MFGIGSWEFLIIAVLALLLFGPDKLPQFARTLGRFMRDFKKYQSMMESMIRGEILAADSMLEKDPFETGKEFNKKVGSGGFSRPGRPKTTAPADETAEPDAAEPVGDETEAQASTEPSAAVEDPQDMIFDDYFAPPDMVGSGAVLSASEESAESAAEPVAQGGEGEQGTA